MICVVTGWKKLFPWLTAKICSTASNRNYEKPRNKLRVIQKHLVDEIVFSGGSRRRNAWPGFIIVCTYLLGYFVSQQDPTAKIGENCRIGPNVVIGPGVNIEDGEDTVKSCPLSLAYWTVGVFPTFTSIQLPLGFWFGCTYTAGRCFLWRNLRLVNFEATSGSKKL